jgi:hypothetical protein
MGYLGRANNRGIYYLGISQGFGRLGGKGGEIMLE